MSNRGYIERRFLMVCGNCQKATDMAEGTLAKTKEVATAAGWKNLPHRGWVCPPCLPECAVPKKYRKSRESLRRRIAKQGA